jgi:hypothetical protein
MTTTAARKIEIAFTGDLVGTQEYEAAVNTDTPAAVQVYELLAGAATTFVVPSEANGFGAFTPKAVTIIKPSDYVGTLILKGSSGASDAEGVYLHATDPDSISIDADVQSSIVLKASADCTVRLIWT